ncbi:MAG: hypothetical protein LC114_11220 [Bryobacterales bacterium]|nr:hypothetical protein [Bryobacterales bacterium]
MSRAERATLALDEIDQALRMHCLQDRPTDRLDLLINRVGAYALRARDRIENMKSLSDFDNGLRDAEIATTELRTFVQTHTDAAVKIWPWIAMTFRRCGRPLEAIWFLNKVKETCCALEQTDARQLARLKADAWFDLAIYSAAARDYSEWLGAADEAALCGQQRSLNNIGELRRRGFRIEVYSVEQSALSVCVPQSEWEPYVGIPK